MDFEIIICIKLKQYDESTSISLNCNVPLYNVTLHLSGRWHEIMGSALFSKWHVPSTFTPISDLSVYIAI